MNARAFIKTILGPETKYYVEDFILKFTKSIQNFRTKAYAAVNFQPKLNEEP